MCAKASRKTPPRKPAGTSGPSVTVRMYRQGLGDCFLLTLLKNDGSPFHMMIDCGLIQGAGKPAEDKLREAIVDIIKTTKGKVDVFVGTHEHYDHLSGLLTCVDLFAKPGEAVTKDKLSVDAVWLSWAEDPKDPLAQKLAGDRARALRGLQASVGAVKKLAGDDSIGNETARGVDALLGFFGASAGRKALGQMDAARALAPTPKDIRYCKPNDAPWETPQLRSVRIYTLGPPMSEEMIKRTFVKKEVYDAAGEAVAAESFFLMAESTAEPANADEEAQDLHYPFNRDYRMPLDDLKGLVDSTELEDRRSSLARFFGRYYWDIDPSSSYPDQSWRRIDGDWLGAARNFALKLDSSTNNTSLVLAIELIDSGKILLFAADAQVGNWLSWQDLSWKMGDNKVVTGPDLLQRTVFYKVGHHGSHNATLKEKGLEAMQSDELVAFLSVNKEMAMAKRWGRMPLPSLLEALGVRAKGRVVRIDEDYDPAKKESALRPSAAEFAGRLTKSDLFYEIDIS
ncbi:MAG TPA: hypothetical protein VE914_11295 [Candidatus Angelobacter sp.]|nr:hypothetical protein [Candidatus Angelobacter sp.]